MKVLICGSRPWYKADLLRRISSPAEQEVLIGWRPSMQSHEASSSRNIRRTGTKYGKRAGFIRNYAMVGAADAVVAVWDGISLGTKHSIGFARSCGKRVFVYMNKSRGAELSAVRCPKFPSAKQKYKRQTDPRLGRLQREILSKRSRASRAPIGTPET